MAVRKIPNLFIIGAAKCATSSLHTYLAQHPQIFMSYLKEPGYFAEPGDTQRRLRPFIEPDGVHQRYYRNDFESYLQLFAAAGEARIVGESSTGYTQLPGKAGVVERIYDFNPEARLIYVLRDPVQRTISHYWWHVQHEGEERDIYTAITGDPYYCDVSHYVMQLEPYLERFGARQVLCVTVEELTAWPEQVLRDIFAWLGVDDSFVPPNRNARENVTPKVVRQSKKNLLSSVRDWRLWDAVRPLTPKGLRSFGRSLAERRIDTQDVRLEEVVDYLRPMQRLQTERLCRLLGREFPQWTILYATESMSEKMSGPVGSSHAAS
jgi:hypothetical protein